MIIPKQAWLEPIDFDEAALLFPGSTAQLNNWLNKVSGSRIMEWSVLGVYNDQLWFLVYHDDDMRAENWLWHGNEWVLVHEHNGPGLVHRRGEEGDFNSMFSR